MNQRDKYKKERALKEKFMRMYRVSDAMREHYESLFRSGAGELRFKNMSVEFLLNALSEIEAFTNDNLAKEVASISKERYNLDVLIHTRNLFKE